MFKQSVLDRIEVIAHSGIRIDGEKVIYIDPVLVNGEPHDADILLFTHPHTDHFSPKDAKKLLKHDTVIAMPKSMTTIANLKLGRKSMPLLPGQTYELCGIKIRTVAAYNTKKLNHTKAKKWLGYIHHKPQSLQIHCLLMLLFRFITENFSAALMHRIYSVPC